MLIMIQTKRGFVHLGITEVIYAIMEERTRWRIVARGVSGKTVTLGRYESEGRANGVMREIMMNYATTGRWIYEMPEK